MATNEPCSESIEDDTSKSEVLNLSQHLEDNLGDYEIGKLFVGGLSWNTNEKSFRKYFEKFGTLKDCVIMLNKRTNKPRGFGFVLYTDPEKAAKVLNLKEHTVDGKQVEVKPCSPRVVNHVVRQQQEAKNRRRVFVGGLSSFTSENRVFEAFQHSFGQVDEVVIMRWPDPTKSASKSRGFGFVTFISEVSVTKACQARYVLLDGRYVEIKKAELRNFSSAAPQYAQPAASSSITELVQLPPVHTLVFPVASNWSPPTYQPYYPYTPQTQHAPQALATPGVQPQAYQPVYYQPGIPGGEPVTGAEPHILPFHH